MYKVQLNEIRVFERVTPCAKFHSNSSYTNVIIILSYTQQPTYIIGLTLSQRRATVSNNKMKKSFACYKV